MDIEYLVGQARPVSSLLHFLGAGIFTYLAIVFLRRWRRQPCRPILPLAIFALACILMLLISGVYHLSSTTNAAHGMLRRLDHAAIFIVIAGTFTPLHWLPFDGFLRWGVLLIVWLLALAALILKTLYFSVIPEWLGLTLYLGLGSIGLVTAAALGRKFGCRFVIPLALGGLSYTVGALVEFWDGLTLLPGYIGPHELLHISVLAGIGFHWRAVLKAWLQS